MNKQLYRTVALISVIVVCCTIYVISKREYDYVGEQRLRTGTHPSAISTIPPVTCKSIETIKIQGMVKEGQSKRVLLGNYYGKTVAVKIASVSSKETQECMDFIKEHGSYLRYICIRTSRMKIMKEILITQALDHHGIAAVLGFCVRGSLVRSQKIYYNTTHLNEDIVEVSEYGEAATTEIMQRAPWTERLGHIKDISEILTFFEAPISGPIRYDSLKLENFICVGSRLKLTGVDNVAVSEPHCETDSDCGLEIECNLSSNCCTGYNARYNLRRFQILLSDILSPLSNFPDDINREIVRLNETISSNHINARGLETKLDAIISKYV